MRNRFLGSVSFLPLYAPEGVGGEQPELALADEPQKDEFAASLEAEADKKPEDQNDPGDLNHSESDEQADDTEKPVVAKKEEPEEPVKDEDDETEQLRKTVKALGKRVSTLSREKRELHTRLQSNIKPVAQEESAAEGDGEQPQRSDYKTKAEFDIAVQAETDRRVAVQEFNTKCNAVETAGAKAFGDKWAKAKSDLAMLDDMGRIPLDLLTPALETDDPSQVLFKLGNDVELATEMLGMTPIKRAIAMSKLVTGKQTQVLQRSKTPTPVDPIGGKGATDDRPSDRDTDEEWNRKEELRERKVREDKRRRLGLA